jgi:oligopeptide/dipeptide ABC transporter ATP-binding protein
MITGEPPSAAAIPSGCAFRTRCRQTRARCADAVPPLDQVAEQHRVACIRWREIGEPGARP